MTSQPNAPFTPRRRQNFSTPTQPRVRRFWRWALLAIVAMICVTGAVWQVTYREEPAPKRTSVVASARPGFPTIMTTGLSDSQKKDTGDCKRGISKKSDDVRYDGYEIYRRI